MRFPERIPPLPNSELPNDTGSFCELNQVKINCRDKCVTAKESFAINKWICEENESKRALPLISLDNGMCVCVCVRTSNKIHLNEIHSAFSSKLVVIVQFSISFTLFFPLLQFSLSHKWHSMHVPVNVPKASKNIIKMWIKTIKIFLLRIFGI